MYHVSALSEYDQSLYEDENTNRLHEALQLWEEISNSRWFRETVRVCVLTKVDDFATKLKTVPLTVCFPDYTGDNSFESALDYIRAQFIARVHSDSGHAPIVVVNGLQKESVDDLIKQTLALLPPPKQTAAAPPLTKE